MPGFSARTWLFLMGESGVQLVTLAPKTSTCQETRRELGLTAQKKNTKVANVMSKMHQHGRDMVFTCVMCQLFFVHVEASFRLWSVCANHMRSPKWVMRFSSRESLFLSKGHLVCYPVSTCMAGPSRPSSLSVSVLLGIHTVSAHPNLASACTAKAPAPKAVNLEKCEQTPVLFCGWERQGLQNPSLELQQNSHTMSYDVIDSLQDVGDLDKHG